MRRELVGAVLVGIVLLTVLPAYGLVFSEPTWRAPAVVAAFTALLVAVAVRRMGRGMAVAALVSGAGLLSMLPWLLGLTLRPAWPSLDTVQQLWDLLEQSAVELELTPAPAAPTPALALPVVAGFWVITHVAHELLVRLRRPGFSLLTLTILWASPLVVPMSPTRTWPQALPFLVGVALTLLATGRWAGQRAEEDRFSLGGLAAATLVIVGAVVAPGLLPGYQTDPWLELGSGAGRPRGYQPIVDVADRLKVPEERELLRVRTSQPTYLRLAGLDSFDGFTWRLGPTDEGTYRPDPESLYTATAPLPPEQPAANTEPVYTEIDVLALENIYVPVPYQPVELLGPPREDMVWSVDGGFLATWDTDEGVLETGLRQGVSYRVRSSRPSPTFDQLAAIEVDETTQERWTQLPRSYDALREQTEAVYEAAGATTNIERALALQDWFVGAEGGFTYDIDVPALRGDEALQRFVLEDKVGYCEYFATAMAVMLRETGVPARVAVGFLPGEQTRAADPDVGRDLTEYTVSTGDAHAWVEVLFPGAGWIVFEPTPRADDSQMLPTANDLTPIENVAERRARELREQDPNTEVPPEPVQPDAAEDPDADAAETADDTAAATATTQAEAGWFRPATVTGWLAVAALLMGGLALMVGQVRRHRRPTAAVPSAPERIVRAQRRLLSTGTRYGVSRRPGETTREVLQRWQNVGRIDQGGDAFARIAQAAAFGGRVDDEAADDAERLVTELEASLKASADRRERLLSPVRVPIATFGRGTRRAQRMVRDRRERIDSGRR